MDDEAKAAALAAHAHDAVDARLQAAIDRLMCPSGIAKNITDETAAEDWQHCHHDDTPLPPDHPGSDERMAVTERHAVEELRQLQRGKLERAATRAAAAVVTANDPVVVAEEAATVAACYQAMMGAWDIRLIDRSEVAVPLSFAYGVPLFFKVENSIVNLAHPEREYGAKPKWRWMGGMRRNQFHHLGEGGVFVAHAYRCDVPGYSDSKLWVVKRERPRWGKTDNAYYGDLLALSPWPLFFTDVTIAKIVAQLCAEGKANQRFYWLPFAKKIDLNLDGFNGET